MATDLPIREDFLGHPKGLFILFFTELWERFSYYGMRAILVLFVVAEVKDGMLGGLGWSKVAALSLYGWYTMSVYVASIPGGLIADRLLGRRKTVMLGGLTLCVGHLVLAMHGIGFFYLGLGLIVAGVGLLKPNISTMVGELYRQGDPRRDKGFMIFYMGINIGAFLSGIIVGYVGQKIGWHYGFGLAGIGMLLGQAVYILGQRHLAGIGMPPERIHKGSEKTTAPLTRVEKDRVLVLLLSFLIVVVFWGAFEQAGGLMNLFTDEKTNRVLLGWEIPASWFQSLNPLFIILLATAVGAFWFRWQKKGRESSSLFKMGVGTAIMGFGFLFMAIATVQAGNEGKAWMIWIVLAYLFHTIGELSSSPVALSFITKLAPLKYASLMMGTYFAVTGLGNKVAGILGELAVGNLGELNTFVGILVFCVLFGGLVIVFLKPLKRLTHGAEDLTDKAP
ncbi:MAG: peptide MFS transporter [Acidobacteria bacterium]|nr:peptide MFS transporter [Acidobacteriota bacterium]